MELSIKTINTNPIGNIMIDINNIICGIIFGSLFLSTFTMAMGV